MIILESSLARLISLLFLSISTLGATDFSSAVSGFCQVFIVFFLSSPLVASANTESPHRTLDVLIEFY